MPLRLMATTAAWKRPRKAAERMVLPERSEPAGPRGTDLYRGSSCACTPPDMGAVCTARASAAAMQAQAHQTDEATSNKVQLGAPLRITTSTSSGGEAAGAAGESDPELSLLLSGPALGTAVAHGDRIGELCPITQCLRRTVIADQQACAPGTDHAGHRHTMQASREGLLVGGHWQDGKASSSGGPGPTCDRGHAKGSRQAGHLAGVDLLQGV